MMSLTLGLFTQVSGSGPLGPLVTKRNNCCYFLFDSQEEEVPSKMGSTHKGMDCFERNKGHML